MCLLKKPAPRSMVLWQAACMSCRTFQGLSMLMPCQGTMLAQVSHVLIVLQQHCHAALQCTAWKAQCLTTTCGRKTRATPPPPA